MIVYRLLKLGFIIVFRTLLKIEVTGLHHVPEEGPFILAVNHLTILDPPVLFVTMPIKRIKMMVARKWAANPLTGWLVKAVEAIYVDREGIDRQAIKAAIRVLKEGGVIGMAPEGTRSRTGGLLRAKAGIAYLATRSKAPILPVGISGQVGAVDKWKRLRRPRVRVNIGPLIYLPQTRGKDRGQQLQDHADQVMIALAGLLDPELRGVYADVVAETPAQYHQPEDMSASI